jgi:hypothetical protein
MKELELADHCEQAGAEHQRGLLLEAFDAIFQNDPDARFLRFRRLVDAGAYLDAAMTLVPEGWALDMRLAIYAPDDPYERLPLVTLYDQAVPHYRVAGEAKAATLALALCAAALRARASAMADQALTVEA